MAAFGSLPRTDAGRLFVMFTRRLSGIGIWSGGLRYGAPGDVSEAAAELDELGYRALWLPDVGGDLFGACEVLLAATTSAIVATGILNLWFHEPAETAERSLALGAAHDGRFLVGIGVSHQPLIEGSGAGTYTKPYSRMVAYLDELDALAEPLPVGSRLLAALGPKMIKLAGERAAGTHPYLGTPDLTKRTRDLLGPGPLVAPEQAVVLESDPVRARDIARQHLAMYLPLPNYARSIMRAGFDEADFADGGSDRLVDRLVAWGDEAAIGRRIQEHQAAGADHVCLQVLTGDPAGLPRGEWRRLAVAFC